MNCFDRLHALCQWPEKVVTSPMLLITIELYENPAFVTKPAIQKYTISHRLLPAPYVLWEPQTLLSLHVARPSPAMMHFRSPRLSSSLRRLPTPTVGAFSKSIAPGNTPAQPTRQLPGPG